MAAHSLSFNGRKIDGRKNAEHLSLCYLPADPEYRVPRPSCLFGILKRGIPPIVAPRARPILAAAPGASILRQQLVPASHIQQPFAQRFQAIEILDVANPLPDPLIRLAEAPGP